MPNTEIKMETGRLAVKGAPVPATKVRKFDLASEETRKRLRALEIKKQKAAEKRGPWKDATRDQRAEAKKIADEIREVKAELIAEHEAAKDVEREKQAAAAKRERALRGDN